MKQIDLNNEIVIYQSEDGKTQLDVKTIGKHINNTLKEELDDGIPTVAKFATVQKEVTRRPRRLRISAVEHQSFHATYENAMKEIDEREGRLFQELHRADLSDLWRCGPLSQCRGEGRHVALSRHQEPFLQ